ncbi:hypothetical protein M0R72_18750 [Candidatus Pacearchaeota archaeon]|jgi:hypothetical protein|nr:hypothetical protein [Candidatus Pacearchaeota archaeon]
MSKHIGELQDVPLEDKWTREKYTLYVDWNASPEKIASVRLSNKDEAGRGIIPKHEIKIEGKNEIVNRTLEDLTEALEDLESKGEKRESEIMEDIKRGCAPGGYTSKEDTPEIPLPEYGLKVRRARQDEQRFFFIVKGTEKEDPAIKPPFKIEIVGEGAFVSVSIENIRPLVEKLKAIFQSPSMRE